MSDHTVNGIAECLRSAHRDATPIAPFGAAFDIDGAYAIQRALVAGWLGDGRVPIGRKIGLTSAAMQHQLGVDQPDFGVLFADMVVDSGAPLALDELIAPKIEPEIGLILDHDLEGPHTTAADVHRAVGGAVAALEIIDSRVADWRIGIADTIADNASSAGVVLASEVIPARDLDLARIGCTVSVNGLLVATGAGAAVMGHPFEAVAWLARTLAPHGEGLRAGDLILPGSMTPALPLDAGSTVRASMSGLGTVSIRTAGGTA